MDTCLRNETEIEEALRFMRRVSTPLAVDDGLDMCLYGGRWGDFKVFRMR